MKALVTGATGFVGSALMGRLERPTVLSRKTFAVSTNRDVPAFEWQPHERAPPAAAFEGVEAIFHLAGDPIAEGRWTEKKKARIRDSRAIGTRNLVEGLRGLAVRPRVLVSASAVGYYGDRGSEELTEQSPAGRDFLADVCAQWEQAAVAARELGMRVVTMRTGIVLGPGGGALAKMLTPFKLGLGSPLGSGNQYMSWVQIDDLVELMLFAARHETLDEPVNGVAPNPVTNREFTHTLGRVLGRPTFMPAVPPIALKVLIGDFGEVLLASQRVVPRAALKAGFSFRFSELEAALRDVLKR